MQRPLAACNGESTMRVVDELSRGRAIGFGVETSGAAFEEPAKEVLFRGLCPWQGFCRSRISDLTA